MKDFLIIDGHCDSILDFVGESFTQKNSSVRDFFEEAEWGHVDFPKLRRAGVTCQTMAMYVHDDLVPQAFEKTCFYSRKIDEIIASHGDVIAALCAEDILRAKREGKVALLKSIEGGEALADGEGKSYDRIRYFHDRNVRLAGLTYNRINPFGRGLDTPGATGLTDYGKGAIDEMARLGMILDVSHMSDESLADALERTELPLVASHSNSRSVHGRSRNLTDPQLEAIAATGGLAGLMYPGVFVDGDPQRVTFRRLMDHLDHMLSVVGPDHVGLGSDFDGYTAPYGVCMTSALDVPKIARHMLDAGWSEEDTAKVMGLNWLRVIGRVCG